MTFIKTADRTNLFVKDWGSGSPVVFLHGWALGSDMWEYQMPWLVDRGLRCVAYDRRGCGRSGQPGHGYDFDTFADDLAAVLGDLDLRDVTLVGHSMGGAEIARYLSRHGAARVKRSVLVSSILPFLLKTEDNPDGIDGAVYDFMIAQLSADRPGFLSANIDGFFGDGGPGAPVSPALKQWIMGLFLQSSPKATIDMVRAFSATDFRPDLRAFTMPTLLIHGDADQTPIALTSRRTTAMIPGSQLVEYAGAAHGLFVTEKDRLNADLLGFATAA